ncbi:MAG: sulfotransferase family protein [Planctomycetaceae bacterium]
MSELLHSTNNGLSVPSLDSKSPEQKRTPQGPLCVWHGLSISGVIRFLRMKPPIHPSRWLKVASLFVTGPYNSLMNRLESLFYKRRVQQVQIKEPPIFILGHWRSGTTMLHNMMFEDEHMTCCNLYEVLNPGHFLLTESVATTITAPFLPKTRPMDNMPLNWTLPQEDETALLLNTPLLSPYLMMAFHSDSSVYDNYYEFTQATAEERERWKEKLLWFIKKLSYRHPNQRILLKSPTHTYRIPLLLEMFPDAKFIYISRDPYAVFQSTMHLRKTLLDENGLTPLREDGLEENTLATFRRLFDAYERDRHLIAPNRLYEIRYEDYERDPLGELRKIYEALDLPDFDKLEAKLKPTMTELREYKKNKFRYSDEMKRRMYETLKPIFERFGYDSGLPEFAGSSTLVIGSKNATAGHIAAAVNSEPNQKRFTA